MCVLKDLLNATKGRRSSFKLFNFDLFIYIKDNCDIISAHRPLKYISKELK